MSFDMKPRNPRSSKSSASRRRVGGNTLVGLFVGLVIGVLAAAGVVWYIFKTPAPFSNKMQQQAQSPQSAPSQQAPAAQGDAPMALPGKPGDPIPQGDKPRFDFYKILPGNADAIPEPKSDAAKGKSDEAKGKSDKDALSEPVFLQTGSFQSAGDADNQKAKLAMMGAEASIQQIMLQDKVWYRVRLGPFKKMSEVSSVRAELAKQGIEANVVK